MDSDSVNSTPVLRVTTDISEVKDNLEYSKHNCNKPLSRESRSNLQGNAFSKRKILHPIYGSNPYQARSQCGSYISMQNAKSNVSAFTQRIMSAKLLRVKQLQNQLAESQTKITELINENKLLKTLQRRQDTALKKYEGSQEQLPQLIKSHNEEIRILNARLKQLKLNYRVMENKLRDRDNELLNLKEQHKHLLKLSRDKQLGDREKLTKKLEEKEHQVISLQNKIDILNRKIELEGKNYRHRLNLEVNKYKESQTELREARKVIDNIKSSFEGKQKYVNMMSTNKIVRPLTHANQQSRISLPAPPPNVSIRQPQRLVHSETAINRDDDSDSDSFSFGLRNMPQNNEEDSCSDRSNSENGDNKINRIEDFKEKSRLIQSGNILAPAQYSPAVGIARISNGNGNSSADHSSPNSMRVIGVNNSRTLLRSLSKSDGGPSENSKSTGADAGGQNSVKNNKIGKKVGENMSPLSLGSRRDIIPRRNNVSAVRPEINKSNGKSVDRKISITSNNSFKKSVSLDSMKSNLSEKVNKEESSPPPDDEQLFLVNNNYDQELSNMQSEIEKELELIANKKTGMNSGDIFTNAANTSNSMESAIEELERKFKIFDMPQIRKETEDDINKIVDRACKSLEEEMKFESGKDDVVNVNHVGNIEGENEMVHKDDILLKMENTLMEVEKSQPDIMLGESQKADLLKALNSIDLESKDEITNYLQGTNETFNNNSRPTLTAYPMVNSRSRKRDVIKELFSEESKTVSTK